MKKIILSLVFVLAMSINAAPKNENVNLEINDYCWENADLIVRLVTMINLYDGNVLTYEAQHNVWVSQYEACINNR